MCERSVGAAGIPRAPHCHSVLRGFSYQDRFFAGRMGYD